MSPAGLADAAAEDVLPLPPVLQWRPLAYADIDRWLALVKRIAVEDQPDWVEQRADLE